MNTAKEIVRNLLATHPMVILEKDMTGPVELIEINGWKEVFEAKTFMLTHDGRLPDWLTLHPIHVALYMVEFTNERLFVRAGLKEAVGEAKTKCLNR